MFASRIGAFRIINPNFCTCWSVRDSTKMLHIAWCVAGFLLYASDSNCLSQCVHDVSDILNIILSSNYNLGSVSHSMLFWTIRYLYKLFDKCSTLSMYKFLDVRSISLSTYKESRAQLLNARLLGTDHRQLLLFPYNSVYVL